MQKKKRTIVEEDIATIIDNIGDNAKNLEGKTIVMSGGAGFLGSYFRGVFDALNKTVLSKPCKVISIDNFITGQRKEYIPTPDQNYIISIEGDITKEVPVSEEQVDYVIHAAGLASPVFYKKFPLETIEAAIFGAKHLLELAKQRKTKGFLFFSSSEIYGDPDQAFIPTPETYNGNVSCVGPRSCYDESKRLTESLCVTYHQQSRVPIKIVRPFNVYGPGMRIDDQRVIPAFISQGLKGLDLMVHGHGNQTRTFCYITDAITGFLLVLLKGKEGEAYNIGRDDEEINMARLAELVRQSFDNSIKVSLVKYPDDYPTDDPNRRVPDLTKARHGVGYSPAVDLGTGLARTLRWFREEC